MFDPGGSHSTPLETGLISDRNLSKLSALAVMRPGKRLAKRRVRTLHLLLHRLMSTAILEIKLRMTLAICRGLLC